MKLLIFAHTPPPHHGQSYMVQLMLEGFGGDARKRNSGPPSPLGIDCYHVNARFSRSLTDIGKFQGGKFLLVFWFCAQAVWIRFRYGVENFYYVPAPGKRVALYRDWLVMLLCRPFFKHVILHWQAAGLAHWLETDTPKITRSITKWLFSPVSLSVILSAYNRADAAKLMSGQISLVNNCAPDQCPDFAVAVQPRRQARYAARVRSLAGQPLAGPMPLAGNRSELVKVLFLAHCSHEKGLFDAIEGVVLANRALAVRGVPLRVKLSVAGDFVEADEERKFNQLLTQPEYAQGVEYLGFVSGENKRTLLLASDILCFPSFYLGENQPVSLIEAMSFGLPIVATRWRSLPEMLPPGYPGLVPPHSPPDIAKALIHLIANESGERLREHYLAYFTVERYLNGLAQAIHSLEAAPKPGGSDSTKMTSVLSR